MSEVATADVADLPAITASLASAFSDDPVFIYLMGGTFDERRATLAFEMLGRNMLDHGLVLMTPDRKAAAFWSPPGKWKVPPLTIIRTLPLTLRAYKFGIFRALGASVGWRNFILRNLTITSKFWGLTPFSKAMVTVPL